MKSVVGVGVGVGVKLRQKEGVAGERTMESPMWGTGLSAVGSDKNLSRTRVLRLCSRSAACSGLNALKSALL